jgi:superoxide dismutase, Fe-Mn family
MNRRSFVKNTSAIGLGSVAASAGLGMLMQSCRTSKGSSNVNPDIPGFTQKPLPYGFNALEPYIDSATMDIHYNRHAAAYANNMNEAIKEAGVSTPGNLESLLAQISKYSVKLRNNAGGHYNHESFWRWMAPGGKEMSPTLQAGIETSFGSLNDMKNQFNAAASQRFGSGWAWLYLDKQKALKIGSTPNQDNPLMDVSDIKGYPLLGLDVWEHAYYLKYQNKRADYIAAWWNIVNWEEVERRYSWAIKSI